jgi:hypothetical protein
LNFIADKDPEFVKSVLKNYSPEMKKDRAYEKAFVLKHQVCWMTFSALRIIFS